MLKILNSLELVGANEPQKPFYVQMEGYQQLKETVAQYHIKFSAAKHIPTVAARCVRWWLRWLDWLRDCNGAGLATTNEKTALRSSEYVLNRHDLSMGIDKPVKLRRRQILSSLPSVFSLAGSICLARARSMTRFQFCFPMCVHESTETIASQSRRLSGGLGND